MVTSGKRLSHKARYVFAGTLVCALAVLGMAVLPVASHADNGQKLEEYVFDSKTSSAYALTKAKSAYNDYLNSIGLEADNKTEGYARYLPLSRNGNRFLAFQILGEFNASCPALGCETMIFENMAGGKTRLVFDVFADRVWLDGEARSDKPANVYIQSYYAGPDETSPDTSVDIWMWNDKTEKYEFSEKLEQ